jgi:hypothetical protein
MACRILIALLISTPALGVEPVSITWDNTVIADVADVGDRCIASRQPRVTEDEPFKISRVLTDGLGCGYQMDSAGSLTEFENGGGRVWASALTRNNDNRMPQTKFELGAESSVYGHSSPETDSGGVRNTVVFSSINERRAPINIRGRVESATTGIFNTDTELVPQRPLGLLVEFSSDQFGEDDLLGTASSSFKVFDNTTGELVFSEMLGIGTHSIRRWIPWDDRLGNHVRAEFMASIRSEGVASGNYHASQYFRGNVTLTIPEPGGCSLALIGAIAAPVLLRSQRRWLPGSSC